MSHGPTLLTSGLLRWPSPASQFSKTLTQEGPKWNGRRQRSRSFNHSLPLRNEGPLSTSHCFPNRNTPKLKFAASHTKQSLAQFLIATFRAFAAMPREHWPARNGFPEARKLENRLTCLPSATSKFLIDNFWPVLCDALARHSLALGYEGLTLREEGSLLF